MKLRAQFVIDVDAQDYVTAAEYQRRMETLLESIKTEYSNVDFTFRERRAAASRPGVRQRPKTMRPTGNLNDYDER